MSLIRRVFDPFYDPWSMLSPANILDDFDRSFFTPFSLRNESNAPLLSSQLVQDKDNFNFMIDVQHFKPEEITVKHVGDSIIVEGEHKEKHDEHGLVYRHFVRKCSIPDDVDMNELNSKLTKDGILVITAPKKTTSLPSNERVIPIQKVNTAAVKNQ